MMHPSLATRTHLLATGRTGMGKSTLLGALCRDLIERGEGLLLVDPHGDLADDVRAALPRRRRNDLLWFNAAEPASCRGINPLRRVTPERRAVVVSNLLATLRKLYSENWGPRTEHVLRHALLAIAEVRSATLIDAQRMLVDAEHRRWVLKQTQDEHVRLFWAKEFAGYGKDFGAQVTAPILNKLGAILASPVVREIVTRHRPALDARQAMDRQRIVLAALSKGRIGEDAALLLGGLLIGAFQHAAMGRADVTPEARTPFTMMVDEIGSFVTGPFLELLAEARKYGVRLVMATQSLAAMDEQVRRAMLTNIGTLVAFRAGADDVELLLKEFAGRFRPDILMGLDVGECVVKSGGEPARIVRVNAP
ncbi:MAG: type IV secretion system DNA-binding domain-containing protein [Polyangiaceae bacterium]|nr:type IV secretion system DNA-binding domain-containing protein [Polyangiaceae bacterium]